MSDIGTCIYTAYDSFEAARVTAAFKSAGIPVYVKEDGFGQMFRIIAGTSHMGTRIFVPEESADQAFDILEGMGLVERNE